VFAALPWYFFDPFHLAFFAAGTACDVDTGELEHHLLKGVGDFEQLRGQFEQAADEVQIGCAVAIGQEAVVSDSDKALGQSVEQKAADKVNGADGGLL
jgi:hypothetical protein